MRSSSPAIERMGWATVLPLLCAAHCLATPALVLVTPALALPEAGETAVKAITTAFVAAAGWAGYRVHRVGDVPLLLAAGIAVWVATLAMGLHGGAERAATVAGALLLAGGMLRNATLRHRATCSTCAARGRSAAASAQVTVTETDGAP
jgi:hypothetical protein